MAKAIWFVNYTELETSVRATETKMFTRLKDAKEFSWEKRGYIIRYDDNGNTLLEFFGGFVPSATEARKIEQLLN